MLHNIEGKSNTYILMNKNCEPQVNFRTFLNKTCFPTYNPSDIKCVNFPHLTILKYQLGVLDLNLIVSITTQIQCRPLKLRARVYKTASQVTQ